MIKNSFILLDKIGREREKQIWQHGIKDWNNFLDKKKIKHISEHKKGYFDRKMREAKERLYNEDSEYFSALLPTTEHFRLYDFFRDQALFLDIETSGYYGYISVVGMYNGEDTSMMIRGYNLERTTFLRELSKYKILVTFNGMSYDIPILQRFFGFKLRIPHIDLRHVCSRIGLNGGLKKIEKKVEIKRRKEVEDMQGQDACSLWQTFMATKDKYYLNLLIKYNEEDTINLKQLAEYAIPRLWDKIFKTPR